MFPRVHFLVLVLVLLAELQQLIAFDESAYPSFISEDGNLIIKPAKNRNITLAVNQETSFINVDNINLMHLLTTTQKSIDKVKVLEASIETTHGPELESLKTVINDKNGILSRLNILERRSNGTNFNITRRTINQLRNRLRRLTNRIRNIEILLDKNECTSSPCKNGGVCIDNYNSFWCLCPENWEGPDCSVDVDECAHFQHTGLGCQNRAVCKNKPGGYECQCPAGYYGIHCNQHSSECGAGSNSEMCGHGVCKTKTDGSGFTCICDQGWTTGVNSPACTVDINECNGSANPCSKNPPVPCINVPGSFTCGYCPAGYVGDGFHCTDVDECATNNGGCSMMPLVRCINTMGSRMCGSCPPGYTGNGITCEYRSVCSINNGGCHPLAICNENPVISTIQAMCTCRPGYTGSGYGVNGCTQYDANAIISSNTEFPSVSCHKNPCIHGRCMDTPHGYICLCHSGYMGRNCEMLNDACAVNPCKNGGTCIKDVNETMGFRCQCLSQFSGPTCNNPTSQCARLIEAEEGTITYPEVNTTKYTSNSRCVWIIKTKPEKILNITFSKFNLEKSSECHFDWLQIHDGRSSADHLIGRFCGDTLDNGQSILSSRNSLYLWFRSDHSVNQDGFTLHWVSIDPICGESITSATYGTIKSPGSPGKYPPNRDCYWKIMANPGKRLQIHFFTMQIESHPQCDFDYLAIYDGELTTDPSLVKYCNTSNPPPVTSSGPIILVHFHSDSFSNDYGFQMSYAAIEGIPGCGGVYTQDTGELSPPTVNDKYSNNMVCDYKIKLPPETQMKITFLEFELEDSSVCQFDSIKIYDGPDEESKVIGRYCGEELPPTFTSTSNELLIVFRSDWSTTKKGFRIKYELICHRVFTESSMVFHSPGYPKEYISGRQCTFLIERPPETAISLTFLDFDIESNSYPSCSYDSVKIYDGENGRARLMGTFCGDDSVIPDAMVSTHNYLFIELNTDDSVNGRGFKANYSTINLSCGGIFKSHSGVIAIPDFNKTGSTEYESNMHCTWVLSAPPGYVIQLNWLTFQLERFHDCSITDHVEIFDNNTITGVSTRIGLFCGINTPPSLTSSSNMLTIVFESDSTIEDAGFSLSYIMSDSTRVCDRNYFLSSGYITSPGWPESYPAKKDCVWNIRVDNGRQILLNFTSFELEFYPNCFADYLEIRDGSYSGASLIGKYCGTEIPKTITSMTNSLYIKFHSDHSKYGAGFYATWESTSTGCGGVLTTSKGLITSPNYPQHYGENLECYWKISTNPGSAIEIYFSVIDLETTCLFDYVEIFDSVDREVNKLGRYCNLQASSTNSIKSLSNHVFVKFRSDFSEGGTGFVLNYFTSCHRELTGYSGVLESLNFPNEYPASTNCTWKITVPRGNKIAITFSHFEFEQMKGDLNRTMGWGGIIGYLPSNNDKESCIYDYLEIQDSDDPSSKQRYCGKSMPPRYLSKGRSVYVRFKTDQFLQYSGFRLEWNLVGCGGVLRRPTAVISTPDYPKSYPADTECVWTIIVEPGKAIQLNITDHSLEFSENCTSDSLVVYNGEDETSPQLLKICHENTHGPIVTTSNSNYMYIKFASNKGYNGRGFTATYTTVSGKCGGRYIFNYGIIQSPNYPNNYGTDMHCFWELRVPEGHRIAITFEEFDLTKSDDRCEAEVKLYEGTGVEKTNLIKDKICGDSLSPNVFVSNSDKMLVEFTSSKAITAKGFKASYSMACGKRVVTKEEGYIRVREYQMLMQNYDSCTWTIIAENPTDKIALTFTDLNIFAHDTQRCNDTKIIVYNGESTTSPVYGEYCDNKAPPTIFSDGNALTIDLKNLNKLLYHTFDAHYTVVTTTCGGDLRAEHGSFTSPMYPSSYPIKSECIWTFKPSSGNKVHLTFVKFQLEESENCDQDYIEFRKGNSSGEILGIYCGNNLPMNITSDTDLWVKFHSDGEGTSAGFYVDYSYVHGNILTGDKGLIASPLYPKTFRQKTQGEFSWTIMVNFGSMIRVNFKQIRMPMYESQCDEVDSVVIYDGADDSSEVLLTACGLDLPESVESTTNVLYIVMRSTGGPIGALFLLEWTQVVVERDSEGRIIASKPSDACGSKDIIYIPEMTTYNLKSPGYPHGYGGFLNCEWIFETTKMNHLTLTFVVVDMEESSGCTMDWIKVYKTNSYKDNEWHLVQSYCLSNTSGVEVNGGSRLKVVFGTDSVVNGTGFEAVISSNCGSNFTETSGELQPTYSNLTRLSLFLRNSQTCEWSIAVRPGRRIKLELSDIFIQNIDADHCSNYLMLRNGQWIDSPVLGKGKYCDDSTTSDQLETIGNRVYIKFTTTRLLGMKESKFKIKFSEISSTCDQKLTLTYGDNSTTIMSPNYPNIPDPYTECTWIIRAPAGERLKIDFVDRFDLTVDPECKSEYVEIKDGATEYSESIGKFCTRTPSSQKSTGNSMYITFFTNIDEPKNGFKAIVSIDVCGGSFHSMTGSIHLPPNIAIYNYKHNISCEWIIHAPLDYIVKMDIEDLQIPESTFCDEDYVGFYEITPDKKEENGIAEKLCRKPLVTKIASSTNVAKVKMFLQRGTVSFSNSKFLVNFEVVRSECGGYLNTPEGTFSTPSYLPTNYFGRYCDWKITVPVGRRVTLEIYEGVENFDRLKDLNIKLNIYDDHSYASPLKFNRSNENTIVVDSSSNKMMVNFWIRYSQSVASVLFKARYSSNKPSICQSSFSGMEGVIENPNVNDTSYYCEYEHVMTYNPNELLNENTVDTRHTLMMIFSNVAIGMPKKTPYCPFLSSRITLSISRSILYKQICGNFTEPLVLMSNSHRSVLKIRDREGNSKYTINYKVNECGGVYSNVDSSFKLQPLPIKTGNIGCAWTLKPPNGLTLQINAENVKLANGCEDEYLNVRYRDYVTSPNFIYCASNLTNITVRAMISPVTIEYWARQYSNLTNLDFAFSTKGDDCGGLVKFRRVFGSPNYPSSYGSDEECTWEIQEESGYRIKFFFVNRFALEKSTNCSKDFVEIYDYVDNEWISMDKLCGREFPHEYNSTSNKMKIVFRSDSSINSDGFQATWTRFCGGKFEATTTPKYIHSPGYPLYSRDLKCIFDITAPEGKSIKIMFANFTLERKSPRGRCEYDNVTFESLEDFDFYNSDNKVEAYCGTEIPKSKSFRNGVRVGFNTDKWMQRAGFVMLYILDSCGGVINDSQEIRSQPEENEAYEPNTDCLWNITAPSDKIVIIRFRKFVMERAESCYFDHLTAYDGYEEVESAQLVRLCGNHSKALPVIKSKSNKMILKMMTDFSSQYEGFIADVVFGYGEAFGCDKTWYINSTTPFKLKIEKDKQYRSFMDCHWLIVAPKSQAVRVKFESFHVAPCANVNQTALRRGNCSCDYLEIRDGNGFFSPLIDRYCGHDIPNEFVTSHNMLWIRFVTDGTVLSTGVEATISSELGICGETKLVVDNKPKFLTSPGFAEGKLPKNIRCRWTVDRQENEYIYFKFLEFDLAPPSADRYCNEDTLDIVFNEATLGIDDENNAAGDVIRSPDLHENLASHHRYCGKNSEKLEYSPSYSSPNIILQTGPGSGQNYKGFKIEYGALACIKNYTKDNGLFYVPSLKESCVSLITVPMNRTISFYFINVAMMGFSNVTIKDGPNNDSIILRELIDFETPLPLFSSSNILRLEMVVDGEMPYFSLIGYYTSTDKGKGCGGNVTGTAGILYSPTYPVPYRKTNKCEWIIETPHETKIGANFKVFDLGGKEQPCDANYVKFFDHEDREIVKFCPGDEPAKRESSSNYMRVVQQASKSNVGIGWFLEFSAIDNKRY